MITYLVKIRKKTGRIMRIINTFCIKDDRHKDYNQQGNDNVGNVSNDNTIDHQRIFLNEHQTIITCSSTMRHKSKNIVLFTDRFLKTLRMGELNRYIKSFPESRTKQLNHHILEEHHYDAAAIHVKINDLLKGTPDGSLDSICNDIFQIA